MNEAVQALQEQVGVLNTADLVPPAEAAKIEQTLAISEIEVSGIMVSNGSTTVKKMVINLRHPKEWNRWAEAAQSAWDAVVKQGGLSEKISDYEFALYPISNFQQVTCNIRPLVGQVIAPAEVAQG